MGAEVSSQFILSSRIVSFRGEVPAAACNPFYVFYLILDFFLSSIIGEERTVIVAKYQPAAAR
jgi:hypothetical protein